MRLLGAALALVVLVGACQSTATVEMMDTALTPTAQADDADAVDRGPGAGSGGTDVDAPDSTGDGVGGARFELQGELPLEAAEVDGLIAFIEQETGRPFLRPPVIVAQSSEAFIAGLQEELGDFEEDAEDTVRYLQALGLTSDGVAEVAAAFEALLVSPEGILGYYDPAADELYVPVDASPDGAFRSLLVHELTHALDGQYSDLTVLDELVERAEETGNSEPVFALQGVAEGRATAVQNAWADANGVEPEIPDDLGAAADVPAAMVLSLGLPYLFGEQWVNLNGGPAGTWDALDDPPPSSEALLVPGTSAAEVIVDVTTPPADGPVLDEFVFGAADLFVWLLGDSLEPDPGLILPTITAMDGWAGGRAVLWGDETESCVRISLAADSAGDLAEIGDVAQTWAGEDAAARSVELRGDRVTITGCGAYVP